jgi:hypothetical protein
MPRATSSRLVLDHQPHRRDHYELVERTIPSRTTAAHANFGVGRRRNLPLFPSRTLYSSGDSFSALESSFALPALIVNFNVAASSSFA